MNNSGSFGAPIGQGAGDAIKAAMARRGMDSSVLNANTQSPSAVQVPPPAQTSAMPPTAQGTPPPMPPTTSGVGTPPTNSDQQIALNAMAEFIKSQSKINEAQAGLR